MTRSPVGCVISDEDVSTFHRDGVVCLRGLFSDQWVADLRVAAEDCMDRPGLLHAELAAERGEGGRFFHDTFIWMRNESCRRFVFESVAAEIASRLMQSEKINVFFDQWLIKEPGTTTKTPWHHDMTYWPIVGQQICTVWLALDPVSADSGAVEYVKGSHQWGKKYRPASFGSGSQYTEEIPEVPDIDAMREELDIVQFDLEPGDCTVHHALLLHGAPGNRTPAIRRRAHTSRWAGDDVTFDPRDGLQEMPTFPKELKSGDPLDSELWPRIIA
jgi:ectoine hydroxylase-related dioxygenase (phytanoyl-CoA dioxygenase family)